MIYAAILLAALYLNRADSVTIMLALLIALTRYLPTDYITNYYLWNFVCISSELTMVIICAYQTSIVSIPLLCITSMLGISHIINIIHPRFDSYYIVAQYLEYMQIICFVLVSPIIINYLKRKVKLCLQKFGCGY